MHVHALYHCFSDIYTVKQAVRLLSFCKAGMNDESGEEKPERETQKIRNGPNSRLITFCDSGPFPDFKLPLHFSGAGFPS